MKCEHGSEWLFQASQQMSCLGWQNSDRQAEVELSGGSARLKKPRARLSLALVYDERGILIRPPSSASGLCMSCRSSLAKRVSKVVYDKRNSREAASLLSIGSFALPLRATSLGSETVLLTVIPNEKPHEIGIQNKNIARSLLRDQPRHCASLPSRKVSEYG